MILTSSFFFGLSMAVIFFYSRGSLGNDEIGWSMSGLFMFLALVTFLKGVFSEKRMHDDSHHSLP